MSPHSSRLARLAAPAARAAAPEPSEPPTVPEAFVSTPNAERHLLEADALRRQQLRAALLRGSRGTWRERNRLWPPALTGVIVVAVVVGAIAVAGAFRDQVEINRQQDQRFIPAPTLTGSPSG